MKTAAQRARPFEEVLEYRRRCQGVIGVESRIPVRDRSVLSLIYTPGVAAPCLEIARDPSLSYVYTGRGRTVGIVTDGSAVYQQGSVGPLAVLPVMEGKAVLLKAFAGLDGVPLCLAEHDLDGMVRTVERLAPSFGAFCIEDTASPLCFALEERLRKELDVPVLLNHGHAAGVVVLAALRNALRLTGRTLSEASIVLAGAGAAGIGVARLLVSAGAKRLVLCDRAGALHEGRRERMNEAKSGIARATNPEGRRGGLAELVRGADVFIGLAGGGLITPERIRSMARDPVVLGLAVPEPEFLPREARAAGARVAATSRPDDPDQLDIALAFPGLLHGLLEARATRLTDRILFAAAEALAERARRDAEREEALVPGIFDLGTAPAVASAAAGAATGEGVAGRRVDSAEVAERLCRYLYLGPSSLVPPRARGVSGTQEEALDLHARYQGKLEIKPKVPVRDRRILELVYLPPQVVKPVQEILSDPDQVFDLTVKRNLVAVVSDGTAVLGLGDIGPRAAMPVMEGKAVLFKTFGGVEALPICLDTRDPDEIVRVVEAIAPAFGGINLEDISAPRCFAIEERLKRTLDIPIFHDDQHGTAVVTLAAFLNALRATDRGIEETRVVINGAGASGLTVARMLLDSGVRDLVVCDTRGAIYEGRGAGMNPWKEEVARASNPRRSRGDLGEALKGSDVLIGLSVAGAVSGDMIRSMARAPIVFAMANPTPEIHPREARAAGAAIVATGRSDFPNQVNNSLGFPGIFRGVLDISAREINRDMKVAAARAIASSVGDERLGPDFIIPDMMDLRVPVAVAVAVARAAVETGVARRPLGAEEVEARARRLIYE